MAVTLRKGRFGAWRPHWYGVVTVDGKRRVVNLAVPVKGKTPVEGLTGTGNRAFEASRAKAEEAFRKYAEEARQKGRAEHLTERLIESKTNRRVEHARIADIADRWLSMPRAKTPSAAYCSGVRSACERFRAFMASRNRKAAYLYEVQTADAGAFAEALRETLAPRTAAGYCNLIRSAMARFLPAGTANPFAAMIGRQTVADGGGSVHRVPFTPEELTAILAGAREYDGGTLFGPIVAAACTALRRGDACRLDWSSVDLAAGLVAVRTSKTGERVELPLLAPLREVLEGVKEPRKGPCFPSAARMLADNPDGLTWRFKAIVAAAMTEAGEPPPDTAAVESAGLAAIARLPPGARRDRTAEAFRLYIAGASQNQIADKMGVCKGSVSGWLSFVAGQIGQPVIRDAGPNVRAGIIKHTQAAREIGQRAASLRDWHALRTTFVTLALSANVPIELVRRVTGHRTVEVVLANYFRPGREAFRVALTGSLPNVLTGGDATPTPAAELQTLAAKVGAGTATKEDKRRLRLLAAKI